MFPKPISKNTEPGHKDILVNDLNSRLFAMHFPNMMGPKVPCLNHDSESYIYNCPPKKYGINDEDPIETINNLGSGNLVKRDIELDKCVKVSLRMKKKMVKSSSFIDQAFPILTSIKVETEKKVDKIPIDLVCVIDISKSMQGAKINYVMKTFDYLLEYLTPQDRVSIITFNNKANLITPLLAMTKEKKYHTKAWIKQICPESGTNIKAGLELAFKVLKLRKQKNAVSSIFLLTDGRDGFKCSPEKVADSLIQSELMDDFTLHTFGYGDDHDAGLMTGLSDLKDGNFYYIQDLSKVDESFIDCLGGLISAVGQKVEVSISPIQSEILKNVEITKAYGDSSMWTKSGNTYNTKLLQLSAGQNKDYVLELKIPKNTKELQDQEKHVKVAQLEVKVQGFDGKSITKRAELEIMLINEVEEVKDDDEDDKEVMKNYYRIKTGDALARARELADKALYNEARESLKSLKEELSNCDLKEENFIKNLVKDIDQAILIELHPENYLKFGRLNLIGNARAQIQQKSYMQSANNYATSIQMEFLKAHQEKKK